MGLLIPQSAPTFDEWVEYCFRQGQADFNTESKSPDYAAVERRRWRYRCDCWLECEEPQISETRLVQHLIRLFRDPAFLAERFTDDQIGDGTWHIFGCGSMYFRSVWNAAAPAEQAACISLMPTLYRLLYDPLSCRHGSDPDGHYTNDLRLDVAVYMVWDLDPFEEFREKPELALLAIDALDCILRASRTATCLASALHGLGHLQPYHKERVQATIDRFLAGRSAPEWVRGYAASARHRGIL